MYGNGYVTSNKAQIKPDPGVYVYELTGAMVGGGSAKNGIGGGGPGDGDPVSLASGQFVQSTTDLALPDTMPIQLTRTYTTNDHYQRPFGVGTTDNYDYFMVGDTFPYTYQELILPNGSAIRFNRTSPGGSYFNAAYLSTSTSGPWFGAILYWNPNPGMPIAGSAWLLKTRDGTTFGFPDALGLNNQSQQAVLGMQDRNGNLLTLTRDQNAHLTKITSPMGRWISLSYDAMNRISGASDSAGRTVSYTYDTGGRLGTVTDVNGGITTYGYNTNDQVTSITDARGINYLTNEYDGFGRVTQQTLADGSTYLFKWTPSNTSVQQWVSSTPPVNRYDPSAYEGYTGLIAQVSVTDPRGYVHQVSFNNVGMPVNDTKALGQSEMQSRSMIYYADNTLESTSDPLGRVTFFDYDLLGNIKTLTQLYGTANAATTSFTFDPTYSNLLTVTDPLNHTATLSYDVIGNLVKTQDPLGSGVTIAYSAGNGQPSSVTDALGNMTTFAYLGGDLTNITDPLGNQTVRFPDAAGRTASVTDPLGNVTHYKYNNMTRLTETRNAQGHVAKFTYDGNGNQLSLQDYQGYTTQYIYDSMHRVISQIDPLQRVSGLTYGLGGFPVQSIDRKGQVTSRTFDGIGRSIYTGFGAVTAGGTTSYQSTIAGQFDSGNRLTTSVDSALGTITRGYDGFDRLLSETSPQGGIAYTYDAAGRRITAQASSGALVSYAYDDANKLTGITQGTTQVGFTYDNDKRRTMLSLPNGVNVQYGYDQNSRLQSISYVAGSNMLGNLSYVYDAAGRRSEVNGSLARTNLPFALGQATYDAANQLSSWDGAAIGYDANGNTVTDISGNQYVWNARNQLTGISGTANASFTYDPFGRRVSKALGGPVTSFVYDGMNRVAETSTSGTTTFLTGGVDEYFLRSDGNGTTTPLSDALGSTIATTDGSGNLTASYWYDPYGSTTVTGIPTGDATQFTGRENDGTGLYYYRARYYNPQTGRFISQDPIGFGGGSNFYAYARNSPTNYRDVAGLKPNTAFGIGLDGVGLLTAVPGVLPPIPGLAVGVAAAGASVQNDPQNPVTTAAAAAGAVAGIASFAGSGTAIGTAGTGVGLGVALGSLAWDAAQWVSSTVIVPVFTPDASQSDTIDSNGVTVSAPNSYDWHQP